jgi:hypothetical protein
MNTGKYTKMFELLNDFSSPDSSKLPCSADSGTTRVQEVEWVLPKITQKKSSITN